MAPAHLLDYKSVMSRILTYKLKSSDADPQATTIPLINHNI